MTCFNCQLYDKNDYIHAYGTCEPQDEDYHCTHECNLSDEERDNIIEFIKRGKSEQAERQKQWFK